MAESFSIYDMIDPKDEARLPPSPGPRPAPVRPFPNQPIMPGPQMPTRAPLGYRPPPEPGLLTRGAAGVVGTAAGLDPLAQFTGGEVGVGSFIDPFTRATMGPTYGPKAEEWGKAAQQDLSTYTPDRVRATLEGLQGSGLPLEVPGRGAVIAHGIDTSRDLLREMPGRLPTEWKAPTEPAPLRGSIMGKMSPVPSEPGVTSRVGSYTGTQTMAPEQLAGPRGTRPKGPAIPAPINDMLYKNAVDDVRKTGKAGISYFQRRYGMNWGQANQLAARMEADGIISTPDKGGKRAIHPPGMERKMQVPEDPLTKRGPKDVPQPESTVPAIKPGRQAKEAAAPSPETGPASGGRRQLPPPTGTDIVDTRRVRDQAWNYRDAKQREADAAAKGPIDPTDIKGPKPSKKVPMGQRIEGEVPMTKDEFGDIARKGASGFPGTGVKGKSPVGARPEFINPLTPQRGRAAQAWATIKRLASPTAINEASQGAAQIIRATEGIGRRQTSIAERKLDPFAFHMARLPTDAAKWDVVHYIQTGGKEGNLGNLVAAKGVKAAGPFEELTKALAQIYHDMWRELSSLDIADQHEFRRNYLPQMFLKADEFRNTAWDRLRGRKIPTYKDAMERGHVPITNDPVKMTLMYMQAMRRFLDLRAMVAEGIDAGYVKRFKPGQAEPPNVRYLDWGAAVGGGPSRYYANDGWATVFNNYVSKGFRSSPEVAGLYDGLLYMSNASTAIQLGFSAFHASTMVRESYMAALADAVKAGSKGDFRRSYQKFKDSPKAPYSFYKKGSQLVEAYLGGGFQTPESEHMASLLSRSNLRVYGLDDVYKATAMGNFAKTWLRSVDALTKDVDRGSTKGFVHGAYHGTIETAKQEGRLLAKDWKQADALGRVGLAASTAGKIVETVAHPLFYHYIPRLKAGVWMDRMGDWLKDHPLAAEHEQVAAAQRIADVVDDQFGELAQNNIFWDNHVKQTANLLLTSTGWTMGTMRLFGQGAADLVHQTYKTVKDRETQELTDRAAYTLVSGTIGVFAMGALYYALHSAVNYYMGGEQAKSPGQPSFGPWGNFKNYVAPYTGGIDKYGALERALLPGYEKDIMGWVHDPAQELTNKLNPLIRQGIEQFRNKDYMGFPIRSNSQSSLTQAAETAAHVLTMGIPISVQNYEPTNPQSQITRIERLAGIRQAPRRLSDPETTARAEQLHERKEEKSRDIAYKKIEARGQQTFDINDMMDSGSPPPRSNVPARDFSIEDMQ